MADLMINLVKRYRYETLTKEDSDTGRRYVNRYGEALPSVTTILEKTKDKSKLIEWVNRIGEVEAERIKNSAAAVGSSMHAFIEATIKQRPIAFPKYYWQAKAYRMAAGLIEAYFPKLDEVWGNEVMVYSRGRYAGTTDLAGRYNGQDSIVDFKQSLKMKRRDWIDDYFIQLTAYASAHNEMYNTKIRQGVILMASQTGEFQEFILSGRDFDHYLDLWNVRVAQVAAAGLTEPQSHLGTVEQSQHTDPALDLASLEQPEQGQIDLGLESSPEAQACEEFEALLRRQAGS
jgi:genome maintenance exonuclease 1